jgi:hypothetical protein
MGYGERMKKRLLIFGLLGPALGYLVLWGLIRSESAVSVKLDWLFLALMYALQFIPLCVCGFVDFHLQDQWRWERLVAAVIAGFLTHMAMVIIVFTPAAFFAFSRFSLVGVVPAVICSWLSDNFGERVIGRSHTTT